MENVQSNATALSLQHLTLELLKLITKWEDQDSPLLLRIAHNFTHVVSASPPPTTIDRSTFLQQAKERHQSNPNAETENINCVVDVNEAYGRAKVWLLLRDCGLHSGFQQERISLFSWRRLSGEWYCYRHADLRGQGPIPLSLDMLHTDSNTVQRLVELAASPENADNEADIPSSS